MQRIDDLKEELKKAILESQEYKDYKKCEEELAKLPDVKRAVDDFRRKNFEIQFNDDIQDVDGGVAWIEGQYVEVRNMQQVKNFFAAELCLCRMIQDICVSVVDVVDFDVNFLNS